MAGAAYAACLKSVRIYRRIRRRVFRRLPEFIPDSISDALDYVNPMMVAFTAIAIWSSPQHFFRRLDKVISAKSPFFPNPLKLITTVSAWLVLCCGLASISIGKPWVIAYLIVASLTTPIWATPPSLVVLIAKDIVDAPMPVSGSSSAKLYYMRLGSLGFKPKTEAFSNFSTLLSLNTYAALDYSIAVWAYVYLTTYFLFAISVFLFLTLCIGAIFMSGIFLVVIVAGLLAAPLFLIFVGYGGNYLFVEPYLQMIANTTPKEYEKEIEEDFLPLFIKVAGACLNLEKKPPFRVGRPIDDLFVAQVAVSWHTKRAMFLEHERVARNEGAQHFSRFLIARMHMAERICSYLYLFEMGRFEWWIRTGDMFDDLTRMGRGQSIDVPLETRRIANEEFLRGMIGPLCPPDCMEVFLTIWNRREYQPPRPGEPRRI